MIFGSVFNMVTFGSVYNMVTFGSVSNMVIFGSVSNMVIFASVSNMVKYFLVLTSLISVFNIVFLFRSTNKFFCRDLISLSIS